jgi:hypothetical protein
MHQQLLQIRPDGAVARWPAQALADSEPGRRAAVRAKMSFFTIRDGGVSDKTGSKGRDQQWGLALA